MIIIRPLPNYTHLFVCRFANGKPFVCYERFVFADDLRNAVVTALAAVRSRGRKHDYHVNVIRHYNVIINFYIIWLFNFAYSFLSKLAERRKVCARETARVSPTKNSSKCFFLLVGADGDKVCTV